MRLTARRICLLLFFLAFTPRAGQFPIPRHQRLATGQIGDLGLAAVMPEGGKTVLGFDVGLSSAERPGAESPLQPPMPAQMIVAFNVARSVAGEHLFGQADFGRYALGGWGNAIGGGVRIRGLIPFVELLRISSGAHFAATYNNYRGTKYFTSTAPETDETEGYRYESFLRMVVDFDVRVEVRPELRFFDPFAVVAFHRFRQRYYVRPSYDMEVVRCNEQGGDCSSTTTEVELPSKETRHDDYNMTAHMGIAWSPARRPVTLSLSLGTNPGYLASLSDSARAEQGVTGLFFAPVMLSLTYML